MEPIVLIVEGGIGKEICATGALRQLRAQSSEREIVVISGQPDPYHFNPNVTRHLRFGLTLNFWDEYVIAKKATIAKVDPYATTDYIQKKKHITEIFCDLVGVPCKHREDCLPEIFLTRKEIKRAETCVKSLKKPLMLIQIQGGPVPKQGEQPSRQWARGLDKDVAADVVKAMSKTHHVMQIGAPTQPQIPGAQQMQLSLRDVFALASKADKVLCIDSFLQHACAALGTKATVCWMSTDPKVLGYDLHDNITGELCSTPHCHRPALFDIGDSGQPWECPYGEICTEFSSEVILASLLGENHVNTRHNDKQDCTGCGGGNHHEPGRLDLASL